MAAVRKGYINAARTRVRKYPFNLLTPGDYLEPYPWEDRDRVRYAMLKWNAEKGVRLTISRYPNGSPENNDPHIIVGWPKGEEGQPRGVLVNTKTPTERQTAKVPKPAKK